MGDLVELRLGGEGRLRIAEAAKGAALDLVGINANSLDFNVGNTIRAPRHHRPEGSYPWAIVCIGACIEHNPHLFGYKPSISLRPGSNGNNGGMTRALGGKLFVSLQNDLYGAQGSLAEGNAHRLYRRLNLPSKSSSNLGSNHADLAHRKT